MNARHPDQAHGPYRLGDRVGALHYGPQGTCLGIGTVTTITPNHNQPGRWVIGVDVGRGAHHTYYVGRDGRSDYIGPLADFPRLAASAGGERNDNASESTS